MTGGLRLRRQRAGMMDTAAVLHLVAESASIRRVGASQRRFGALAVCGLHRRQNGQLQWPVCAMGEWDAGAAGGDPCALGEIRLEQCRNLGGVVIARSAVAAKMELCARVGRVCKTIS